MNYFYIKDHGDIDKQIESAKEVNAKRIMDCRNGYKNLENIMKSLNKNDFIYIYELNVFGTYKGIMKRIQSITEMGASIISIKKPKVTISNSNIKDILPVIEYFSNIKIETDKGKRKKGLERAKKKGKVLGRPKIKYPPYWDMVYIQYRTKDISAREAWESLNLKKSTFYNLIKKYEEERNIN